MRLRIVLPPDVGDRLRDAADAERRSLHKQAEVALRRGLGMRFPVPALTASDDDRSILPTIGSS